MIPLLTIWLYAAPCVCPVYCHHGSTAWCRINHSPEIVAQQPKRWRWTLPLKHHRRQGG